MSNSNPVSLDLLNKFKHASSATISSTLAKKGYRFIYMAGIRPLKPGAKLVGRAITLRYLPSREDHVVSPDSRQSYAQQIAKSLKELAIRVEIDTGDDTIGKKLRTHRSMRPAYLMILGDDEQNNQTVSFMGPDRKQNTGISLEQFISNITEEINSKK